MWTYSIDFEATLQFGIPRIYLMYAQFNYPMEHLWLVEFYLSQSKSSQGCIGHYLKDHLQLCMGWPTRINWKQMAKAKSDGSVCLQDIKVMSKIAMIILRIWSADHSIWGVWMRSRYNKGITLREINPSPNQSPMWFEILRSKDLIELCEMWSKVYSFIWKGKREAPTSKNIYNTITIPATLDPLACGIWSCRSSKMSVVLWCLRWNHLHTFSRLQDWRIQTSDHCVLCGIEDETPGNLFWNSQYIQPILLAMMTFAGDVIWKSLQRNRPTSREDIRLGDVIEGAKRLTKRSPCWGLHWVGIATMIWHIWLERNRRWKQHEELPNKAL